jgi:ATP-dependent DNA helicase RecQ
MIALRPFQTKALWALNKHHHVLCIAPTGSGKSMIFEEFIRRHARRTLLISPLVALARQQAEHLRGVGISVHLSSGSPGFRPPSKDDQAWICSPETLFGRSSSKNLSALSEWKPDFLVVDECHCLWEWGRNFRPSFNYLPTLIKRFQIKRSLWLTATLPPSARQELREHFDHLFEMGEFALPKDLSLYVLQTSPTQKPEALVEWLRFKHSSGIVFAPTREETIRVTRILKTFEPRSAHYHAGMSREERVGIEQRLQKHELRIVVATSAFGMGMNYPQLEWCVLTALPPSLLFLAQAAGRVGRGSRAGQTLILWNDSDFERLQWFGVENPESKTELSESLAFVKQSGCRARGLKAYFEPDFNELHQDFGCGLCDFCLSLAA